MHSGTMHPGVRYLITFVCYGSRLYGDERSSVDHQHNVPGGRFAEPSPRRTATMREHKGPRDVRSGADRSGSSPPVAHAHGSVWEQ